MWNKHRTAWAGIVLLAFIVSGCQNNASSGSAAPDNSSGSKAALSAATSSASSKWPPKLVVEKWTNLPDSIIGNALACDKQGGVYSIGGYNGKHSINKIYRLDEPVTTFAKLPTLLHDEAAGWIGDSLYIIGGGQSNSYDTIYQISADRKVKKDGHFPMPISDVNAIPYNMQGNPGLMILGGYDGTRYNMKVRMLRQQGNSPRWDEPFQLPVGLRYSAVTTNGHDIFIAGGKTPHSLSDKVYTWSDKDRKIKVLAVLPGAREKAAAFVFENRLWIVGGMDDKGKELDDIVEINTDTGETKVVQHFPTPIADMGYSQVKETGYLAGGQTSKGQYSSTVYKITVKH